MKILNWLKDLFQDWSCPFAPYEDVVNGVCDCKCQPDGCKDCIVREEFFYKPKRKEYKGTFIITLEE